MSVEIKSFIRPTQIVRGVMRAHGRPAYQIWTNKYEKCRTVKCYVRSNPLELVGDIRTALVKAGVNDFQIKTVDASFWVNRGTNVFQSLIVRIPNTEQA